MGEAVTGQGHARLDAQGQDGAPEIGRATGDDGKEQARQVWASGSYPRIAQLLAGLGRDLVAVAGVGPGLRVLDVAAGTGNAAIPAAQAGATVTAADLTPELLAVGRASSERLGVAVDWVEADAEELPFPSDSFDLVLSAIGVIFAPDHARAAAELVRVCRPGGTIALANWTPDGYGGAFFRLLSGYAPAPPAGAVSPTAWGEPGHLRELFDGRVEGLTCTSRRVNLDFADSPEQLSEIYRTCFGPILATRAGLADPSRQAALDRGLLELLRGEDNGPDREPGRCRYEIDYLAMTATRLP